MVRNLAGAIGQVRSLVARTLTLRGRILYQVQFDLQVIDDELLAFLCILAHIIFQDMLDMRFRHDQDGLDAHVGADEPGEFVGGDLAQPFKAGDLGLVA